MSSDIDGSFFPKALLKDEMTTVDLNGPPKFAKMANDILLGTAAAHSVVPCMPDNDDFIFSTADISSHEPPLSPHLSPPTNNTSHPPPGKFYPTPPPSGYHLQEDHRYSRGFVYAARYDLSTIEHHKQRLLNITMPPSIPTSSTEHALITGMVRLVPGIPFVFQFNGDWKRTHTIACVQTLASLKGYADFDDILKYSVQLARLSWGCEATDTTPVVKPVYEISGLKTNDRSAARSAFQEDSLDGSYSLGNTVMKGEGLGTVLPSVQANSSGASAQLHSILNILHKLRRLIMPKCLSKFEHEIFDFHMNYNNVFSFGGLEPNGTSVQLNVSSVGIPLHTSIGVKQGFWHTDKSDDPQWWTIFTLLFRLPPDADPGPFFIARGGVYVHEMGAWIVFVVFKGTDVHSGVAPTEDPHSRHEWIRTNFASAWNLAGPQNRLGYVSYTTSVASKRTGSLNVSLPTGFGNYGSSAAHKTSQNNFTDDGSVTMGPAKDRAVRLAIEAISNFRNSLSLANMTSTIDIDTLLQSIRYTEAEHESPKSLSDCSFAFNPNKHESKILKYLALYKWHAMESHLFNIRITTTMLKAAAAANSAHASSSQILEFPADFTGPFEIVEILNKFAKSGEWFITMRLAGHEHCYNVPQQASILTGNETVQRWISQSMAELPTSTLNVQPALHPLPIPSTNDPNLDATDPLTMDDVTTTSSETAAVPNSNLFLQPVPSPTVVNDNHIDAVLPLNDPHANPVEPLRKLPLSNPQQSNELPASTNLPPPNPQQSTELPPPNPQQSNNVPPSNPQLSKELPPSNPQQSKELPPSNPQQSNKQPLSNPQQNGDVSSNNRKRGRSETPPTTDDDSSGSEYGGKRPPPKRVRERSESSSDSDSVSGSTFDVEKIVVHDFSNPEDPRWLIKWQGYDDKHNSWVSGDNMMGAVEYVYEYNCQHGLENFHLQNIAVDPILDKVPAKFPRDQPVLEFAANVGQLVDLLNAQRLENELSGLIFQFQQAFNSGKDYWTTHVSISDLINTWSTYDESSNDLLGTLSIFDSDSLSSGILRFKQLQMSLAILPSMAPQIHKLDLINRAYQRETCRTLVTISDWYTTSGPIFCELLITTYRVNTFAGMKQLVPVFADLIDHIVQHAYASIQSHIKDPSEKPKRPPRSKTSRTNKKRKPQPSEDSGSQQPVLLFQDLNMGNCPNEFIYPDGQLPGHWATSYMPSWAA